MSPSMRVLMPIRQSMLLAFVPALPFFLPNMMKHLSMSG
jgi:hypothetical protein